MKYVDYPDLIDDYDTILCSVYCANRGLYFSDRDKLEKRLTNFALKELDNVGVRAVGTLPSMRGGGGDLMSIIATIILTVKTFWSANFTIG